MDAQLAFARPRIGLLGNPSDLYGGKVVAFTFDAFETVVKLEPQAAGVEFACQSGALTYASWGDLLEGLDAKQGLGGHKLLAAAFDRLLVHAPQLRELPSDDPRTGFRVTFSTDVPLQAGLSGSSAIIIAALRLWSRWFELEMSPFELSELALSAESDVLSFVAGPQDRVVQSYGGLVAMDFTRPRSPASYHRLDPALLPDVLVVWSDELGTSSADVHHDVYERWAGGDADVRRAMEQYTGLVERGLIAMQERDVAGLADAIDANFDARASIFPISEGDQTIIDLGREHGAATKFCGSGGAVLAVPRDPRAIDELEELYRDADLRTLRPRVGPLEASFSVP
jgi:glucuronokinase